MQKCVQLRDAAAVGEKAYDICVCLVDVDQHTTLEGARRLAESESILMLVSNLKFEVWLRWHAEDKRSVLSSSQLDQRAETLKLVTGKGLALRFPIDDVDMACRIARAEDPAMELVASDLTRHRRCRSSSISCAERPEGRGVRTGAASG